MRVLEIHRKSVLFTQNVFFCLIFQESEGDGRNTDHITHRATTFVYKMFAGSICLTTEVVEMVLLLFH